MPNQSHLPNFLSCLFGKIHNLGDDRLNSEDSFFRAGFLRSLYRSVPCPVFASCDYCNAAQLHSYCRLVRRASTLIDISLWECICGRCEVLDQFCGLPTLGLCGGGIVHDEKERGKHKRERVEKALLKKEAHEMKKQPHENRPKGRVHAGTPGARQPAAATVARDYGAALSDPYDTAPPSLGFGKFGVGVANTTAFLKGSFITTANDFVVIGNPYACCNSTAGTVTAGLLTPFVCYNQVLATSSTAWNAATATAAPSSNCTVLGNIGKSSRVVSCGLRVKVGQAVTSAAGIIGGMRVPGILSGTALDVFTNATALTLPASRSYMMKCGFGEIDICWTPQDLADFDFTSTSTYANSNGYYQPLVVYGTGLPVGTRVFYEFVANVEMEQGVQSASNVISNFQAPAQASLSQVVASPDQLMSMAAQFLPALPRFNDNPAAENYNSSNTTEFWSQAGSMLRSGASWAWDNRSSIAEGVEMLGAIL